MTNDDNVDVSLFLTHDNDIMNMADNGKCQLDR